MEEEKGGDYMFNPETDPIATIDDLYSYYDWCCSDSNWRDEFDGRMDDFELACSNLLDDLRSMYSYLFQEED